MERAQIFAARASQATCELRIREPHAVGGAQAGRRPLNWLLRIEVRVADADQEQAARRGRCSRPRGGPRGQDAPDVVGVAPAGARSRSASRRRSGPSGARSRCRDADARASPLRSTSSACIGAHRPAAFGQHRRRTPRSRARRRGSRPRARAQVEVERAVDVVREAPLERRGHRPVEDAVLVRARSSASKRAENPSATTRRVAHADVARQGCR